MKCRKRTLFVKACCIPVDVTSLSENMKPISCK